MSTSIAIWTTIAAALIIAGITIKFDFPVWAGMLAGLITGFLIGMSVL